jgi:hypothetical protein
MTTDDRSEVRPHSRGVTDVSWDNLGYGYRMTCSYGFVTVALPFLTEVAEEMELHWENFEP